MFDFSWSEILIIGAVALVVIGPKDLPKALKTAGIVVRRARGLAREFHESVDDMIREADLADVRKSIREATQLDPGQKIMNPLPPPPPPSTEPPPSALDRVVEPELPLHLPELDPVKPPPEP